MPVERRGQVTDVGERANWQQEELQFSTEGGSLRAVDVALPFVKRDDGVAPGQAMECQCEVQALSRAGAMSRVRRIMDGRHLTFPYTEMIEGCSAGGCRLPRQPVQKSATPPPSACRCNVCLKIENGAKIDFSSKMNRLEKSM